MVVDSETDYVIDAFETNIVLDFLETGAVKMRLKLTLLTITLKFSQ